MSNPHLDRAWMLIRQRRYADAEKQIERALEVDCNDALAWAYRGICVAALRSNREGRKLICKALELEPRNAYFHYLLAWSLDPAAKYHEVLSSINEALTIEPE